MMKKSIISIFVLILMLSAGCGRAETADLVIVNGRVFTADSLMPEAEAVAVRGNVIIAVGSREEISRHIDPSTTRVIDAAGSSVMPGFNDAHAHFGPVDPDYIELRYITDPAGITEKVREQVSRLEKGQLVYG